MVEEASDANKLADTEQKLNRNEKALFSIEIILVSQQGWEAKNKMGKWCWFHEIGKV